MIRKLILAFGISVFALSATACNTVRGAAEDVESVANAGDRAI